MNFETLLQGRVSVSVGSNFEIGRLNYTVTNVIVDKNGVIVELKCIDYDTRAQTTVRVSKPFREVMVETKPEVKSVAEETQVVKPAAPVFKKR